MADAAFSYEAKQRRDGRPIFFDFFANGVKCGAIWLPGYGGHWNVCLHRPKIIDTAGRECRDGYFFWDIASSETGARERIERGFSEYYGRATA